MKLRLKPLKFRWVHLLIDKPSCWVIISHQFLGVWEWEEGERRFLSPSLEIFKTHLDVVLCGLL